MHGNQPVDQFIETLTHVEAQVAVDFQVGRLRMLRATDPPLPFPYSSQVDGELRELRCHYGSDLYRILYRRSQNLFVLLHAIHKNTGRIPQADINIAHARWADFQQRMNTVPRVPPRAIGRDAPPGSR